MAELPRNVLSEVLGWRYPDNIAGTYGALAVSRAWRDAAPGSKALDLLLYVDQLAEDTEQLGKVGCWLQRYPHELQHLQLRYRDDVAGMSEVLGVLKHGLCVIPSAPALQQQQHLTRLCLDGDSSLLLVAPLLLHLQQLQHLEAGICMMTEVDQVVYGWDSQQGVICTEGFEEPLQQLPDVSAARALTSLHLIIAINSQNPRIDDRFPQLLPSTLQQLHLAVTATGQFARLGPAHLTHLTNLQALTLKRIAVEDWEGIIGLHSLKQVALHDAGVLGTWYEDAILAGAGPLLVELRYPLASTLSSHASALTALKSLHIRNPRVSCTPAVLQQLTGLTQLDMLAAAREVPGVMACCAGLSQLRAMGLHCRLDAPPEEVAAAAAALTVLTQLTSLDMTTATVRAIQSPWGAALASLTGLKQLHLPAALLGEQPQWLAALTALQLLVIQVHPDQQLSLVQQLSSAPCTLQRVMLCVHGQDVQQVLEALRTAAPWLRAAQGLHNHHEPRSMQVARLAPHLAGAGVWQLLVQ